jgi:membrane protein DedA with SNARE-associated domain
MSGARFWLANIFGSSLWAVSILLLGVFAVENYEVILQYLNYVLLGVVVVGVVIHVWKKRTQ